VYILRDVILVKSEEADEFGIRDEGGADEMVGSGEADAACCGCLDENAVRNGHTSTTRLSITWGRPMVFD
jgi:hypothetical protein